MYERLARREQQGNLRCLSLRKDLIDFASNDYLGLAKTHFECSQRGSTGSRLLTGNSQAAEDLEEEIARFHGYKAGVLFNCGYMANLGLITAIANTEDAIFYDVQIHASMLDGIRLSKAKGVPFRHNDVEHLKKRLHLGRRKFICVESVYSTDGSQAPLKELCNLAKQHDAYLIVDEAHAVGVFGPEGRGLVAQQGLCQELFAQVVTFGKALGAFGAIVLGSKDLKQTLINFAHSFIYTTALPYYALEAIRYSYQQFPQMESQRKHLRQLIALFASDSKTPIQAVMISGNEQVKKASARLMTTGFDVRALTSPTVQRGKERLRICLHASNTKEEVQDLLRMIQNE